MAESSSLEGSSEDIGHVPGKLEVLIADLEGEFLVVTMTEKQFSVGSSCWRVARTKTAVFL